MISQTNMFPLLEAKSKDIDNDNESIPYVSDTDNEFNDGGNEINSDPNMETFNQRHILGFGDEILLLIADYLRGKDYDHGDLVNLAATCTKFYSLLQDRSLSGIIKFYWNLKTSRYSLVRYLKERSRSECLTKFNVTDLYWIPSGTLRDIIVQMTNLKELLTAGARLSWNHLKEILTNLDYVESLSWSWDSRLEESIRKKSSISSLRFMELIELKPKFLKLKNLLLHVPLAVNMGPTDLIVCSFTSFVYMISLCKNLEQLWIISWPKTSQERKFSSNFYIEVFESDDVDLPNLRVLVVDVKEPARIHVPRLIVKLLKNIDRNKIKPRVLWLDDPLINMPFGTTTRRGIRLEDRAWPDIDLGMVERFSFPLMSQSLRLQIPNPLPSCKAIQISHGMATIVNLNGKFEGASDLESFSCKAFNFKMDWRKFAMYHPKLREINLLKNEGVTYPDYCAALAELPLLEKISVPLEVLVDIKDARIIKEFDDCLHKDEKSEDIKSFSIGFKKKRVGASTKPNSNGLSGLQLLTQRCSSVKEFEIGYSSKSCHAGRLLLDSLFYIPRWKFLRKLSLDGIPIHHGKFLVEIAKSASLHSIRLSNLGPSGKCIYMPELVETVHYSPNLKDLRVEQNYMGSVTQLLISLQECSQLQRLLLWSSPNDTPLDCDAVYSLFESCKSLTVFYAAVEPTYKRDCKKLRKSLMNKYKNDRPSLSIFIETSLEDQISTYPSVHFRQMVVNSSQVCQYYDFPSFD